LSYDNFGKDILFNIEETLQQVDLGQVINSLPDKLDTIMGENAYIFSSGMKQKLAIARSLLKRPKLSFFDESTNALDNESEIKIVKLILKKIDTVIFVSHNLEISKFFDRKYKIDNLKLVPFND
jgi:ABC-type bacteriocin/lantibiotic exporter with double-glycine peptidase domain